MQLLYSIVVYHGYLFLVYVTVHVDVCPYIVEELTVDIGIIVFIGHSYLIFVLIIPFLRESKYGIINESKRNCTGKGEMSTSFF